MVKKTPMVKADARARQRCSATLPLCASAQESVRNHGYNADRQPDARPPYNPKTWDTGKDAPQHKTMTREGRQADRGEQTQCKNARGQTQGDGAADARAHERPPRSPMGHSKTREQRMHSQTSERDDDEAGATEELRHGELDAESMAVLAPADDRCTFCDSPPQEGCPLTCPHAHQPHPTKRKRVARASGQDVARWHGARGDRGRATEERRGKSAGTAQARARAGGLTTVCRNCDGLVDFKAASAAARRDEREVLRAHDGCFFCGEHYRASKHEKGQRCKIAAVLAGTRAIVARPAEVNERQGLMLLSADEARACLARADAALQLQRRAQLAMRPHTPRFAQK